MDNVKAAAYLRRYEGFSKLPYKCPTGHLTIGYGHNLENGISAAAAEFILQEDLARGTSRQRRVPMVVETGRRAAICDSGYGIQYGPCGLKRLQKNACRRRTGRLPNRRQRDVEQQMGGAGRPPSGRKRPVNGNGQMDLISAKQPELKRSEKWNTSKKQWYG